MLTFNDVYHAPLGTLKASVDDWTEMAKRLERLADSAHSTMVVKAKDEYWRGINAQVTKAFITKTGKEFDDAAQAAKGIETVLRDGYNAFKNAQAELRRIVEVDAPAQGLVVTSHGKVVASHPLEEDQGARHDPDYELLLGEQRAKVAALQKRLDRVVETCDDADTATSNALKANVTADKHNFSTPKYRSLDAEEAHRALTLAAKGRELSHEQLVQLNELLRDNHASKEFARAFYGELGPKRALEFFGQLSTDTYDYAKQDPQRLKDVQQLQQNLGLNLATATRPATADDPWTQKWSEEMRRLGTERILLSKYDYNGPYGYQLLGGIMRYGNYDPKFLNPIAQHVVQLHAKDPYMFSDSKGIAGPDKHPFNPSGRNGAGYDPVISMLEALGHSPEAAKEFFTEPPEAYAKDGTLVGGTPLDGKGNQITSYLDYFATKDYTSFPDIVGHHPDEAKASRSYVADAFGHALESATLGHAYDDATPELVRDARAAQIMEEVVMRYGTDPGLLKHQEGLADSLGRMGAGYVDDINWALNDNRPSSVFSPDQVGSSVPAEGRAEFGAQGVTDFLSAVGKYPDAYADISNAEKVYTVSMLEAQVGSGGRLNQAYAEDIVRTGSEVHGRIDNARASQVEAEGRHADAEYNKALQKRAAWVQFGTGVVVAAGAAFLPPVAAVGMAATLIPVSQEAGTGLVGQMINQAIGEHYETKQKDSSEDIQTQKASIYAAGKDNAKVAYEVFLERHGMEFEGAFGSGLEGAMKTGYLWGINGEASQGSTPQVSE
ncbi:hypothetical protein RND61_04265 [Streptomyces sp. TRM76323]|uniref:AG2 protein n=1 Tax=Streptomyces tamarix TaxID=3078565 RepID=A0ABU3QET8_9ACTN|nr:DUF6571 family protein [Streptomyces tamarix]MDT9681290.1 hypothetical protein [Streptomyces tamarix]